MISLRGHLEHSGFEINPGNFLALLNFGIDAGNQVLAEHFRASAHNAKYKSPKIQNDLISCVRD